MSQVDIIINFMTMETSVRQKEKDAMACLKNVATATWIGTASTGLHSGFGRHVFASTFT